MDRRLRLIAMVLGAIALLFCANYGYGLAHELAHTMVIDSLGGHVSAIYVNALGTDAYTEHTPVTGESDLVLVNAAGLCMTTALALAFATFNHGLLAAFLAVRSAIYAVNYSPGTDTYTIHAIAGNLSIVLSLAIVAINLACICAIIRDNCAPATSMRKRLTAGLSSSLSRVRPARNN